MQIDGVRIIPLQKSDGELHMLRADDPHFRGFGEIYFSTMHPGAVKAWHLHKRMELNYTVVVGEIKLVLFDDREESPTRGAVQEILPRAELVTIPALVWNGFKGIGSNTSIVANCATVPHDPTEIVRMDPLRSPIPYDWGIRPNAPTVGRCLSGHCVEDGCFCADPRCERYHARQFASRCTCGLSAGLSAATGHHASYCPQAT